MVSKKADFAVRLRAILPWPLVLSSGRDGATGIFELLWNSERDKVCINEPGLELAELGPLCAEAFSDVVGIGPSFDAKQKNMSSPTYEAMP